MRCIPSVKRVPSECFNNLFLLFECFLVTLFHSLCSCVVQTTVISIAKCIPFPKRTEHKNHRKFFSNIHHLPLLRHFFLLIFFTLRLCLCACRGAWSSVCGMLALCLIFTEENATTTNDGDTDQHFRRKRCRKQKKLKERERTEEGEKKRKK